MSDVHNSRNHSSKAARLRLAAQRVAQAQRHCADFDPFEYLDDPVQLAARRGFVAVSAR